MQQVFHNNFRFSRFAPIDELHHVVEFFFVIEAGENICNKKLKVPSSLYFDLLIPVHRGLWVGGQAYTNPFLSPVLRSFKDVQFQPASVLLGIRIKPEAMQSLANVSPSELAQDPNEASGMFSPGMLELLIQIMQDEKLRLPQQIALIQKYLARQWQHAQADNQLTLILQTARQQRAQQALHLADQLGYSLRWLQKQTQQHLGLSPKQMLDVLRINNLLQHVEFCTERARLTELGYDLGYCDQSHFIKSVRRLAGESPSRLLKSDLWLSYLFSS